MGWPAKGSSASGVKIRMRYPSGRDSVTKVVSEKLISRASIFICSVEKPSGVSGTTHRRLPWNGVSVNASTSRNATSIGEVSQRGC